MRPVTRIAVVNLSSLHPHVVLRMTQAVRRQLTEHVAPAWGRVAPRVACYDRLDGVPPDAMPVILFDRAWNATSLGYHTETPDGRAFARVFIDVVLADGGVVLWDGPRLTVASVLSHEAAEMFIDPDCNVWADGPPSPRGACYALEICDAVNGDVYPVPADDGTPIGVSNFLYPNWFDPEAWPGARVDHLGHLSRPFSVREGGHVLVRGSPGTETMLSSAQLPGPGRLSSLQHPAARTMRRATGTGFRPHGARATSAWSETTWPSIGRTVTS